MTAERSDEKQHRVLGRVGRSAFVGRSNELLRIVKHAESPHAAGLLLLLAPTAGVSELLRQAYDDLFNKHGNVIPVYFSLQRETRTAVSTAIEFLNTFLTQYLAFRRNDPSLCLTSATLSELLELAPADDYDWIAQLVEAYKRERFNDDDESLVRWCLSAPQRVPIGSPSSAVKPIVVATDTRSRIAQAEQPLPRCATTTRPAAMSGARCGKTEAIYS